MKFCYLLALIPALAWGDGTVGSSCTWVTNPSYTAIATEIRNKPGQPVEIRCVDPKSTLTIRTEALGVTIKCKGEK